MSVNAVNAYTQVQTQNSTTNNAATTQPTIPTGKSQSSAPQDTVNISEAGQAAQQTTSTAGNDGSK